MIYFEFPCFVRRPRCEVAAIGGGAENAHPSSALRSNQDKNQNFGRVPLRHVSENRPAAAAQGHSHLLSGAKRVAVRSPRPSGTPVTHREVERPDAHSGAAGGRSGSRTRGNFMRPTLSSM